MTHTDHVARLALRLEELATEPAEEHLLRSMPFDPPDHPTMAAALAWRRDMLLREAFMAQVVLDHATAARETGDEQARRCGAGVGGNSDGSGVPRSMERGVGPGASTDPTPGAEAEQPSEGQGRAR